MSNSWPLDTLIRINSVAFYIALALADAIAFGHGYHIDDHEMNRLRAIAGAAMNGNAISNVRRPDEKRDRLLGFIAARAAGAPRVGS